MQKKIELIDKLNEESWNIEVGRNDNQLAYTKALEAEKLSIEIGYDDGEAFSLINQGWYFITFPDYIAI